MFKELNVLQKLRTVSLLQQELFDLITEESGATTANPVLPRFGKPLGSSQETKTKVGV